ncbi:MAG: thioredoxin family protein [Candidatus Eisenbacteria sp.]|nr:thioredoxin family protein [Candidatus Eisenbacteria bacterium]
MNRSRFVIVVAGLCALVAAVSTAAHGQFPVEEVLSAKGFVSVDKVALGSSFQIGVEVRIVPPWHVNAHVPTGDFMVPTELLLEATPGVTIGRTVYPRPVMTRLDFSDEVLAVYQGRVVLGSTGSVSESAELGPTTIHAILSYQACNDEACIPPAEVEFEITLEIVEAGSPSTSTHAEIFESFPEDAPRVGAEGESGLGGKIREEGLLFVLLMVFVWGLGLNLTPCVYPMIPLTVGYFGAQAQGRMSARLWLGFMYFLGIAIMYSALGVIAAATGGLFGAALQSPVVLIVVAAILVALALSMFGLWEIRLPTSLMRVGGGARRGGLGALVMGFTVGIVAAPCVGAMIAALLIYVAEVGDLFLGFWLFFALSCGLGLPFLVLAVFSSSISSLPKSGEWMSWVKRFFGVVLIVMAVYFLRTILPSVVVHYLLPLCIVVGAIYLGFIDRTQTTSRAFSWLKRGIGLVGIIVVIWMLMAKKELPAVAWEPYTDSLYSEAVSGQKPVIIDFTADWCIPCHELEKYTFTDSRVLQRASDFAMLRVDLTRSGDTAARSMKERFEVVGVPTLVFVTSSGQEVMDLRVVGFIEANEFLERMEELAGRQE